MPEIPEIGVKAVAIPEIPEWRAMPPQSIPEAPPITLQIGFPVANIPGCVETRTSAAGDKEIYNTDPEGNVTVCGGEMPSYKPIDYTPGTLTYGTAKPPLVHLRNQRQKGKKSAGDSNQPTAPLPSGSGIPDNLLDSQELPCPPPDAIPIGAKNKSQTAVVIGYKRVDGKVRDDVRAAACTCHRQQLSSSCACCPYDCGDCGDSNDERNRRKTIR